MFSKELDAFLIAHAGNKIVFTNGCFDILHKGHVTYLTEAKKLGDLLVIGLNSDASVKRLKGPERPINNEVDRQYVMSQLKAVDFVEIFHEDTPLNLILKIKPSILVKGGDWKIEQIVGAKEVIANGGEVYSLNFVDGYSTTGIIHKIQAT
jgi:rfaE bifunctional protein nucleotidyltransferase chain/domain